MPDGSGLSLVRSARERNKDIGLVVLTMLNDHLCDRAGCIDGIGIQHAVAAIRHRRAGLDPHRGRHQWQRRIGRRADQIV